MRERRWETTTPLTFSQALAVGDRLLALGLKPVPSRPGLTADTLTTAFYPAGVDDAFVGRVGQHGVAIASGLHAEIKGRYFRVGHMGVAGSAEIAQTVSAIEAALKDVGYLIETGLGVAAARAAYAGTQ